MLIVGFKIEILPKCVMDPQCSSMDLGLFRLEDALNPSATNYFGEFSPDLISLDECS